MRISIIGTLLGAGFACVIPTSAAPPVRVMVLDGEQAGAYHAWQETTPYASGHAWSGIGNQLSVLIIAVMSEVSILERSTCSKGGFTQL
jgi:hypothetical protein